MSIPADNLPIKFILLPVVSFLMLLGACSQPATQESPTLVASTEPSRPTQTFNVPTQTLLPKSTSEPAHTATIQRSATPENTPTATPTQEPVWVRSLEGATIYQAPGDEYPALAFYTEGITLTIVGKNASGDWLLAAISPYNTGWIAAKDVTAADEFGTIGTVDEPVGVQTATPLPVIPISISTSFEDRSNTLSGRKEPVLNILVQATPATRVKVEVTAPDGLIVFTDTGRTDAAGKYRIEYWGALKLGGNYVITAQDEAANTASTTIFVDRKVNPN